MISPTTLKIRELKKSQVHLISVATELRAETAKLKAELKKTRKALREAKK